MTGTAESSIRSVMAPRGSWCVGDSPGPFTLGRLLSPRAMSWKLTLLERKQRGTVSLTDAKIGIDPKHGADYDQRFDLLVEADPQTAARAVTREASALGFDALTVKESPLPPEEAAQTVHVFRLPDQGWTQVFMTSLPRSSPRLGKTIARSLGCRTLLSEQTDDCWGGYALFDKDGTVLEISWLCVNDDLMRFGPELGLDVEPVDEDERYEDVVYFDSVLRADRRQGDLEGLVRHLGAWLDSGKGMAEAEAETLLLVGKA